MYMRGLLSASILLATAIVLLGGSTLFSDKHHKEWTEQEWQLIQSLSIDNLGSPKDPGNSYFSDPKAAQLGRELFFDRRLSRNGTVSCATCHRPEKFFTDGKILALGQDIGKRNTPSLLGVAHNNWFFWDGRKDSLWSQALAPLENPVEHNLTRTEVVRLFIQDEDYLKSYTGIFGDPDVKVLQATPEQAQPSGSVAEIKAWKSMSQHQRDTVDQVFANLGKSISAYVATLKPVTTRFDKYVTARQHGTSGEQYLSADERAGLRLFLNQKSQCINCHSGPLFTNQSFHNIGTGRGRHDSGRAAALDRVRFDRFNCLGKFSDATETACSELRFMSRDRHAFWGAFKTPTLRNISNTAPYFHDGRAPSLEAVLEHYTSLSAEETHMQPVKLTRQEKKALLTFLRALAGD